MSLEPRRSRDTSINYYLSLEHMFWLIAIIQRVILRVIYGVTLRVMHIWLFFSRCPYPCGSRRPRHLRAVRFRRIGHPRIVQKHNNPSPGRADEQSKSMPAHQPQGSKLHVQSSVTAFKRLNLQEFLLGLGVNVAFGGSCHT